MAHQIKFHDLLNWTSGRSFSVPPSTHAPRDFISACSESRPAFL